MWLIQDSARAICQAKFVEVQTATVDEQQKLVKEADLWMYLK